MASISKIFFGSKIRILLTILVMVVGVYALAGFVLVPWLARPKIVETVSQLTGRETRLDTLKINNGSISLTDLSLSAPFTSVISPINFDITGFQTSGEEDSPYEFSATSESGESFSWKGFVALEPLRSKGAFEIKGFSMPKYEPFYDIILETNIVGGTIAASGSYDYLSGEQGVMQLKNAAVTIENVEVVKESALPKPQQYWKISPQQPKRLHPAI